MINFNNDVRRQVKEKNLPKETNLNHASGIKAPNQIDQSTPSNQTGTLIDSEEFVLTVGLSEFRIELKNFYTDAEIEATPITIKEETWSIDSEHNITKWYQEDVLIHQMEWSPGDEF